MESKMRRGGRESGAVGEGRGRGGGGGIYCMRKTLAREPLVYIPREKQGRVRAACSRER